MAISLHVPLLAQERAYCCWHTAAMMIWQYHQRRSGRLGPMNTVSEAYARAHVAPLHWAEFVDLAKKVGMVPLPKKQGDYTEADLAKMLAVYGPLWCCGYWYGACHVIVLTGVNSGDVHLNDPDQGHRKRESIAWFNKNLSSNASCDIMVKDPKRY